MSLTDSQYDEIIRSYNRKNLKNKRLQNERIQNVYKSIPELKAINDEISSLSLKATKAMLLSGEDSDTVLAGFHDQVQSLKERKADLLKNNALPADYLDLKYDCPDCKDTGYIDNKKCHCFIKSEIALLYEQSNLQQVLDKNNFDSFNMDYFSDNQALTDPSTGTTPRRNMEHVVAKCHEFINDFNKENRSLSNLLFFGKTGVGKSFLSYCVARDIIEKRNSVIYLSAINFFDILSAAQFNHNDISAKSKEQLIRGCDLLIIDDLGTELTNSFINSAFFNILEERLSNNRSTIISTNLDFGRLMERYSERIASRLTKEFCFLKLYGEDLRHKISLN